MTAAHSPAATGPSWTCLEAAREEAGAPDLEAPVLLQRRRPGAAAGGRQSDSQRGKPSGAGLQLLRRHAGALCHDLDGAVTAVRLDQFGNPLSAAEQFVWWAAHFLTDHARTLKASTLQRRLVAIAQAHRAADLPTPTTDVGVTSVWRGIRRTVGTAQVGKSALLTADIRQLVTVLPDTTSGIRDRALLLVGFAGAFRRSELVALDVADVEITRDGAIVAVRRSKTDQERVGERIGIPRGTGQGTCPVRALAAWLALVSDQSGPLFRSVDKVGRVRPNRLTDKDVARIVKRAAEGAGFDPTRFAGHSLRSGLATSAAMAGVEERAIMRQTRHKSVSEVRRYIRDGGLFRGNAAGAVGL